MREIKFIGRSTHSDDWCYGSFVNNPELLKGCEK